MPLPTKNAPDWHDVHAILMSLGEEFGIVVVFSTTVRADYVQTIGKAHRGSYEAVPETVFQAMVRTPYSKQTTFAQACYTLAFDIWCQADGGGATAAKRGAPHDWRGRVEVPRRRRAQ